MWLNRRSPWAGRDRAGLAQHGKATAELDFGGTDVFVI